MCVSLAMCPTLKNCVTMVVFCRIGRIISDVITASQREAIHYGWAHSYSIFWLRKSSRAWHTNLHLVRNTRIYRSESVMELMGGYSYHLSSF